jgi:hypothetical protein
MGTGSRYICDCTNLFHLRSTVVGFTPTPFPPIPPVSPGAGGVLGVPWLSDGMFGAFLGAATAWATQLANRKWGKGDKDREDILKRLDEFDKHTIEVNKALLRIELQIKEQGDYIEPLKDVMQSILREKLLRGGVDL